MNAIDIERSASFRWNEAPIIPTNERENRRDNRGHHPSICECFLFIVFTTIDRSKLYSPALIHHINRRMLWRIVSWEIDSECHDFARDFKPDNVGEICI
jgi:hypothetical protein